MAASTTVTNDSIRGLEVDAATAPTVFTLLGGKYGILIAAAVWGGGNVELHGLSSDGTTYVKWGTQVTANATQVLDLPSGTYKFVITTTNDVYFSLSRISQV